MHPLDYALIAAMTGMGMVFIVQLARMMAM